MYASTTREFKEGVFVVHTFQKKCKKVLYFEIFIASSIAIKKIEEILYVE